MKASLTFLGLLLFSTVFFGQQISRSTLSTAGDLSKDKSGISLTWTVGEVFSETIQSKYHVTGGFQQGALTKLIFTDTIDELIEDEKEETTSKSEIKKTNLTSQDIVITLFPNPTTNQIWLQSNQEDIKEYTVSIFELSGKRIFQEKISFDNSSQIEIQQIEKLNSGNYVLQLVDDSQKITAIKFTKIDTNEDQ